MYMSAKSFFIDHSSDNTRLLRTATYLIPQVYKQKFLANARKIAPIVTGGLRRSIVTQTIGNTVSIGWRVPYAASVDAGQHTVNVARRVRLSGSASHSRTGEKLGGGDYMYLTAGVHKHTTGSAGFLDRIKTATQKDMMAAIREMGLTK
jgi:hypothetical protein